MPEYGAIARARINRRGKGHRHAFLIRSRVRASKQEILSVVTFFAVLRHICDAPLFGSGCSDRLLAFFFSANSHGLLDGRNKDFAVPDLAGFGRFDDRIHG